MGLGQVILLIAVGMNAVIWIYKGIMERYFTSELREEESNRLSNYCFSYGGVFLSLLLVFLFINFLLFSESLSEIRSLISSPITFPVLLFLFTISGVVIISHLTSKYPTEMMENIKSLKLADEIYLARVEDVKLSQSISHPYKFTAKMLERYGIKKTILVKHLLFITPFLIFVGIYSLYAPTLFVLIFLPIFAFVLIAGLYYRYKKDSSKLKAAIGLAQRWNDQYGRPS